VLFGYFFLVPLSLQFFAGFQLSPDIENQCDITKYFGMITLWSLGTGVLFELPVILYALARLGVVTAAMLRKGRRLAIVIILIVAAFLTPPDPFSQVLVAMPLYALYEMSIVLAARVERLRARDLAAEEARLAAAPPPTP
jgi:sec-independent protein translocase protein TatC